MRKLPPHLCFSLLLALAVAIGWRVLVATFSLALDNEEYTHILLILPVSLALIFLEWKSVKPLAVPHLGPGLALLAIAGVTGCVGKWGAANLLHGVDLSLAMMALVTWCIGSFVLCFGTRVSLRLIFPLCFLFWLVPLPEAALDRIVVLLQQESATATRLLFSTAGVPVRQDGMFISIPGVTVEVARECSSIRSSLMLLVTTMVLAHLFLRSIWRKAFLVLAAIPLSVAKNAVRIFTLSMLGVHVDIGFLHGNLHKRGGVVFFILALLAVGLLLWWLGRGEKKALHHLPAGVLPQP